MGNILYIMRSFILLVSGIFILNGSYAQKLSEGQLKTDIESTNEGYTMSLSFGNISLHKAEGNWYKLNVPGSGHTLVQGEPEMPYKAYSFLVGGDQMRIEVKNSSYTDYPNYDIVPSKGNLIRTQDPSAIAAVAGPAYQQNKFYPEQIATVANDYMIRSAHGKAIHVAPVQYNPVTHTLRVYHNIELEVKTPHANKPTEVKSNSVWDNLYRKQFVNYELLTNSAAKSTYAAPVETGDMLIATPAQYIPALQAFIDWKKERGIRCIVMNLDTMSSGADPDSIQARIAYHYQQSGITYVLLIGDESDLPPMQNVGLAGPSDNAYGYISGNDHYPDLLIGRYSANTLQELQPQLTKSIEYEKYPTVSQSWYTRAQGIASNEGPGDDNQMDWEHMNAIRSSLLGSTYTYVYESYDGTHDVNIAPLDNPGDPNSQEVVTAINSGVSLINYCGHGSSTSMATTGFSNSHVSSLTNTNGEWPFILTVACVTGEFMNGNTSLGEKLMIAEQSGQPYGMVGGYMSSINQYWDPPMQAQDEINDIISNNSTVKVYATAALTAAGSMSMNDLYLGAGDDMTDTWIFFGDPSLQLRTEASDTLTAIHADSIYFYNTNLAAQLNKQYGTVVLLHADTIYSVVTTSNSNTAHTFAALPAGDSLMVIATAPNTLPYYGKVRIVDTPVVIPTVLNNVAQEDAITLYPNPTTNSVSVKGITAKTAYRCMDITGKLVLKGHIDAANTQINTAKLPSGSYILQLAEGDKKTDLQLQILR
jgi:gingipain R